MTQTYSTLRVARSDEGVLGVVIDAPPMNLIGPELVRDDSEYFGHSTAERLSPTPRPVPPGSGPSTE